MKKGLLLLLLVLISCTASKQVTQREQFPFFNFPFIFHHIPTLPGAFHGGGLKVGARVCLENDLWTVHLGGGWFMEIPE